MEMTEKAMMDKEKVKLIQVKMMGKKKKVLIMKIFESIFVVDNNNYSFAFKDKCIGFYSINR